MDNPRNPFNKDKPSSRNPFEDEDKPKGSRLGQIQGGAEAAMDAATWGTTGVAADLISALGPKTFKELRAERSARKASVPASVRVPIELAASLAAPVPGGGLLKMGQSGLSLGGSLIKQAPQTASWTARTGRAMADASLQSGVAGAANNLNDLTPDAMGDAAKAGLISAGVGGAFAGLLGSGTEIGVRALRRIKAMRRLDKAAFGLADKAAGENAVNYGAAEASAIDTPAISRIIQNDAEIAPIARQIRAEAAYQKRSMTDAEVLMASYKRLSANQREAKALLANKGAGTAGYDPKLNEGTLENISVAKQRALNAAETPDATGTLGIPEWRSAIEHARMRKGEQTAQAAAADIGLSVGRAKSIPGAKQLTASREAYFRKIPKMSMGEAEVALAAILGRFPEQVSLTSSPLGAFGLVTSAVRSPLLAYRTMPIIRALEEKLGRGSMGQGAGDLVRGTSARLIGGLLGSR